MHGAGTGGDPVSPLGPIVRVHDERVTGKDGSDEAEERTPNRRNWPPPPVGTSPLWTEVGPTSHAAPIRFPGRNTSTPRRGRIATRRGERAHSDSERQAEVFGRIHLLFLADVVVKFLADAVVKFLADAVVKFLADAVVKFLADGVVSSLLTQLSSSSLKQFSGWTGLFLLAT